jgi:hypothetical protein
MGMQDEVKTENKDGARREDVNIPSNQPFSHLGLIPNALFTCQHPPHYSISHLPILPSPLLKSRHDPVRPPPPPSYERQMTTDNDTPGQTAAELGFVVVPLLT